MRMTTAVLVGAMVATALAAGDAPVPATHHGLDGWWLRNAAAEAFVCAKPYPRIVAFRLKGGTSPLRVTDKDEYVGVRAWYMEPKQVRMSPLPAHQPAEATLGSRSLTLVSAPAQKCGLQLTTKVELDASRPVLTVRHGFKNLSPEARRIAAWAINAVPATGVGLVPWATGKGTMRAFLAFPGTDPAEPCLHLGSRALGIDFRVPPRKRWMKVGSNSDAGWAAFVWDSTALVTSVPHVAGATYPEGGGTATFYHFQGNAKKRSYGEVENVGPLTDVKPGDTVWLHQTLELVGGVEFKGDSPDNWMAAIERARARQ